MNRPEKPGNPQFRTALIRKLKNVAPDYDIQFVETASGVAFRMIDSAGRYRSKIVKIGARTNHGLEKSYLESRLKSAGFPKKFQD